MAGYTPTSSQKISIPGREGEHFRDISATPGGTIWGTTPGGTKIMYDRNALLFMRNSPMSKTPPQGMQPIPGITSINHNHNHNHENHHPHPTPSNLPAQPPKPTPSHPSPLSLPPPPTHQHKKDEEELFDMES